MTGVDGEDVVSAQVATVTQSGLGQQVALISQDGTQHVSIHHSKEFANKRTFRIKTVIYLQIFHYAYLH